MWAGSLNLLYFLKSYFDIVFNWAGSPNPLYFFVLKQRSKQENSRLKIKIGQILHQFFSHHQSHCPAISFATFADGLLLPRRMPSPKN
jgi:hypothetical protein